MAVSLLPPPPLTTTTTITPVYTFSFSKSIEKDCAPMLFHVANSCTKFKVRPTRSPFGISHHENKCSASPYYLAYIRGWPESTSVLDELYKMIWKKKQTTSSRLAKRNLRLGHAYNIHVFIKSLFNICGDIFMNTCIRKVTNLKKNMSHFQSEDHIKPKLVQCKRI